MKIPVAVLLISLSLAATAHPAPSEEIALDKRGFVGRSVGTAVQSAIGGFFAGAGFSAFSHLFGFGRNKKNETQPATTSTQCSPALLEQLLKQCSSVPGQSCTVDVASCQVQAQKTTVPVPAVGTNSTNL